MMAGEGMLALLVLLLVVVVVAFVEEEEDGGAGAGSSGAWAGCAAASSGLVVEALDPPSVLVLVALEVLSLMTCVRECVEAGIIVSVGCERGMVWGVMVGLRCWRSEATCALSGCFAWTPESLNKTFQQGIDNLLVQRGCQETAHAKIASRMDSRSSESLTTTRLRWVGRRLVKIEK